MERVLPGIVGRGLSGCVIRDVLVAPGKWVDSGTVATNISHVLGEVLEDEARGLGILNNDQMDVLVIGFAVMVQGISLVVVFREDNRSRVKGGQSVASIGGPVGIVRFAMRIAMHGGHSMPREENHPRWVFGVEGCGASLVEINVGRREGKGGPGVTVLKEIRKGGGRIGS